MAIDSTIADLADLSVGLVAGIDAQPRLVFVFSGDGRFVYANAAATRSLGYSVEELFAARVSSIDSSLIGDQASSVCSSTTARILRSWFFRKDGSSFPVEVSISPLKLGERGFTLAIAEDISQRTGDERRAALMFSGSSIGVIFFDAQGLIQQVNPACLEMFGYGPDDAHRVVGTNAFDYMAPDEKPRALANFKDRVVENGILRFRSKVNRYQMVRADGSPFICEARATAIPDGRGGLDAAALFLSDVTEFVHVQEQLRHMEKMEAVGQLAGGVAHDFNNQLTGILGFAEILRERLPMSDPLRGYADGIVAAAKRSAQLTGKLLSFSRKSVLQVGTVDLLSVVREVMSMLERSIDKRIRIVHPERSEPCLLEGDSAQLQNAVLNLAINARDAMPEGGTLAFSIDTLALTEQECARKSPRIPPGDYICVSVEDSGHGMNAEVQRHMFEPFFTTKPKGKGTGLGLASVWGIVKNHDGAIDVESEVGRGTKIRLYFPHSERHPLAESIATLATTEKSLQILLVEDEAIVARVEREMLLRLGHGVDLAVDGIDAVELLCRDPERYHLVVLDLVLPTISGVETFRALRRISRTLPILLTSGLELDDVARRVLEEGKAGFIKKPFDLPSLATAIAALS